MKKLSLVLAGIFCGLSLNAATIATYNGGEITSEEVAPYLAQLTQNQIQDISVLPKEAQEGLIKEILIKKLLAKEAVKNKYDQSKEFKTILASAKEILLAQEYLLQQFKSIKISDKEIKDYYNSHLQDFVLPEAVKTKHILVKSEKEAKDIIAQLKGLKGKKLDEKFSELAKTKSIDPSAKNNGGDLPYATASDLVPEYYNAAKKLKKGEISAPVKSNFGYHIIMTQDIKEQRQGSLEEARASIDNGLRNQKQQELLKAQTEKMLKDANLKMK